VLLPRKPERLAMIAIAAGFLLRVVTLFWGLPHWVLVTGYHPDEPTVCSVIFDFPSIYLSNVSCVYNTAWQYTIGLLLLPVKAVKVLLTSGSVQTNDAYYVFIAIVARLGSVIAGTLAIYLVYRLASRLFGRRAGLIAAALLSVSIYHCSNSAFATLDVPMSCLVVALFLAAMGTEWVMCGAIAGFLMGMKVVAIFFTPAPLLLILLLRPPSALRAAATYIGVATVVLFITTPHMFLYPLEFLRCLANEKSVWYDPAQHELLATRARTALWGVQTAVGTPLLIAFLGGDVLSLRRPASVASIALLAIAAYCGFWGGHLAPRYVIIIAPLLCVFAGFFYATLLESSLAAVRVTAASVLAVVLAYGLYLCAAGADMRLRDTRPTAEAYIDRAVPPGASIAIGSLYDSGRRQLAWRYPAVDFRKYRQLSVLDRPTFLVVTSYDVDDFERALHSPNRQKPPSPQLFTFYQALFHSNDSGYRVIADLVPVHRVSIEFAPPEVKIYQLIASAPGRSR
jgi:hypothetical protein